MAQPTNTFDTYDQIGRREDLSNVISNVFPQDKPFMSMIGTQRVKDQKHEWQIDTLATPSTANAQIEGDEYTYNAITPTTRVNNRSQIMRKTFIVTDSADTADTAGRAREVSYQMIKHGQELELDCEAIMLNNQASVVGNSTTARVMGGLPAWLETNARRGTGGADGGYNSGTEVVDAATDGTQRAFTETLLKDMLQDVFTNSSGSPNTLMMGPFNKRTFSEFTGISDLRHEAKGSGSKNQQAMIIAGADMYLSDWGPMTVVVDRYQRARDVFAINPAYVTRGVRRALFSEVAPKTGDSHRRVLLREDTLIVKNQAAIGHLADLTTS